MALVYTVRCNCPVVRLVGVGGQVAPVAAICKATAESALPVLPHEHGVRRGCGTRSPGCLALCHGSALHPQPVLLVVRPGSGYRLRRRAVAGEHQLAQARLACLRTAHSPCRHCSGAAGFRGERRFAACSGAALTAFCSRARPSATCVTHAVSVVCELAGARLRPCRSPDCSVCRMQIARLLTATESMPSAQNVCRFSGGGALCDGCLPVGFRLQLLPVAPRLQNSGVAYCDELRRWVVALLVHAAAVVERELKARAPHELQVLVAEGFRVDIDRGQRAPHAGLASVVRRLTCSSVTAPTTHLSLHAVTSFVVCGTLRAALQSAGMQRAS